MKEFGQSLDIGASISRDVNNDLKKEQSKGLIHDVIIEDAVPGNLNTEAFEETDEEPEQKPVPKTKSEDKTMAKKKISKSSGKKAAKKMEDDDSFDDDFDDEESGIGTYVFWAIAVIAALLLAMWIFTDWQLCIQF